MKKLVAVALVTALGLGVVGTAQPALAGGWGHHGHGGHHVNGWLAAGVALTGLAVLDAVLSPPVVYEQPAVVYSPPPVVYSPPPVVYAPPPVIYNPPVAYGPVIVRPPVCYAPPPVWRVPVYWPPRPVYRPFYRTGYWR